MKTRTTRLTLSHSEGVFEVEIVDEGVGEYVMVSCGLDRPPFEQRISIGPSEWPFLRDAIDRMFVEIAEHESEKKIKELLETPAPWDTSGASGEEQAEPSAEAPQGARTSRHRRGHYRRNTMTSRDIPVSPEIFFNGIIDHWDVTTAHDFVLRLAREWGYESFALDLGIALIKLAKEMEADQKLKELLKTPAPWEDEPYDPPSNVLAAVEEDSGWIPWNGGECPAGIETKQVVVRLRGYPDSDISLLGRKWTWIHTDEADDIIAYKVVD